MELTALDLTAELAPIIWTMETLVLIAVVWLVAMFFADQMQVKTGQGQFSAQAEPEPDHPGDNEDQIAA